ncbi:MAG: 3-ketoacyl-ACP reductase [Lunatimonas sp.]|uniref:3-ketoacyl-ACP reductase n=1 Tax=Lunatimonas sp. TaxID=2060141 RepID=UPI00263B4EAE|nr:3-ketoacyl-ACP reductase [Lunatimonas sp.]MCC5939448.1 3-ketoacyl-ACP reductase [Lunatimonas sp.]
MKKVALVTGGSRGIGLGIAKCLAKDGFDLAINGMRAEEDTKDSLNALRELGADVLYCRGDVGDQTQRADILGKIRTHFGRLNVLVNNAGVAPKERKDILEASEESFDYVLKTNLNSAYFLSQGAANWMIEQKAEDPDFQGCLINVSSISATIASVNRGEYCIAKAGMSMATQLFAVRLGEFNIPVYEVRPGIIATDMTSGVKEKYDKLLAGGLCVQSRWGLPEDVGLAVASLATGNFPYSTGQVIMVDGGLSLARL